MQTIEIVVVDRHDLSRYGISTLLSRSPGMMHVLGVFADVQSAERQLCEHRAHVFLLDDNLPHSLSIEEIIKRLHEQHPGLNIVILGNKLNPRYITRLLDFGARGFIYKQDNMEDILIPAIKVVRNGNPYLSPRAAALFYANRPLQRDDGLNNSDLSVLHLMEQGYNPQEIAGQLDLTPRSIYRIYGRLRLSLNVRTNEQIVDAARKKGLLDEVT